jgi:hypothetical protein
MDRKKLAFAAVGILLVAATAVGIFLAIHLTSGTGHSGDRHDEEQLIAISTESELSTAHFPILFPVFSGQQKVVFAWFFISLLIIHFCPMFDVTFSSVAHMHKILDAHTNSVNSFLKDFMQFLTGKKCLPKSRSQNICHWIEAMHGIDMRQKSESV